jgi:hypothetical protein
VGLKPTHMHPNRVGFGMSASPSNIYNIYFLSVNAYYFFLNRFAFTAVQNKCVCL